MKKKILRICFKPLSICNRLIKKNKKIIFFYSNLGFRDNVKAFYDYLIEKEYNKTFQIIVSANDYEKYREQAPDNVLFVGNKQGIRWFVKAKYAFYCFGKYPIKPSKKQIVVNLWHGMPLKKIGNMEEGLERVDYNYFTYIVATSQLFVPILQKSFRCDASQVIITGQPRNDVLFRENHLMDQAIRKGAEKVVVWLPTYREEKKEFPIPVIDSTQADALNQMLKENHMRLIVKIHPLQEIGENMKKFSNIEVITQSQLEDFGISIYEILRSCDGLLTDYSSVYFDYMMLNRPIGFTVDDIEEYKNKRGFVFDNPYEYMPGMKIRTYEDLSRFFRSVACGEDLYADRRQQLNQKINRYSDGSNSDRVAQVVFGRENL